MEDEIILNHLSAVTVRLANAGDSEQAGALEFATQALEGLSTRSCSAAARRQLSPGSHRPLTRGQVTHQTWSGSQHLLTGS